MTESGIDAFLAIVEYGTIASAADHLYLTQSALSQRIKSLEDSLGYALLDRARGKRSVTLTNEGQLFLPLARQFKDLQQRARHIGRSEGRTLLNMTAIGCVSTFIMPNILKSSSAEDNGVCIDMRVCDSREGTESVAEGNADLALVELLHEQPIKKAHLLSLPLFSCEYDLVVGPDWKLGSKVSPLELNPDYEIWMPWDAAFDAWHAHWLDSPKGPRMRMHNVGAGIDAITGESFAVVPHFVAESLQRRETGHRIVKLDNGPSRYFVHCVTTQSALNTLRVEKLLRQVVQEVCSVNGVRAHFS